MKPLTVLSLGAGVQSSAVALMAEDGEIEKPDAAVFADTQSEPAKVYRWLDYLRPLLSFPVFVVTAGNLGADFLKALRGKQSTGARCSQPPFYVKAKEDRNGGGMLWRQCTKTYKLEVIRRKTRELMKSAGASKIRQLVGISVDEASRMRDSNVGYIENVYPLCDSRISRQTCLKWLDEKGHPEPPKSACYFCPYISNCRWKQIKKEDPCEFDRACNYDDAIRQAQTESNGPTGRVSIEGRLFLHRSFTPLREAVQNDSDIGQGELDFHQECEGLCGV